MINIRLFKLEFTSSFFEYQLRYQKKLLQVTIKALTQVFLYQINFN